MSNALKYKLNDGLFFEDTNVLVKWNKPIKSLKHLYTIADSSADRTIYDWGVRHVLNGLKLEITTMFWNDSTLPSLRTLSEVDHWVVGDTKSFSEFTRLSNHIIENYGEPSSKDDDTSNGPEEREWIWDQGVVEVRLILFEQHCYKMVLSVVLKKKS